MSLELKRLLLLAACLLPSPLVAPKVMAQNADDTRFRLEQNLDRKAQTDKDRLEEADRALSGETSVEIDGQAYTVGETVSDLGLALYLTTQRKQWADARRFLNAYIALPDHDPMLVHYAQGALARQAGDYRRAEREFRALLDRQADFLPGRLELARVLFEDQQDGEALAYWKAIDADLPPDARGDGIRRTARLYIDALEHRRRWQGSMAAGLTHSDNLNQSSASYSCLYALDDGTCLFDRQMPDPVAATGLDVELSASRRLPLSGHFGLQGRALFFGNAYEGQSRYDQSTFSTQLGLDYRTARFSLGLSPTYDLSTYGGEVLYDAWGVRAEGSYTISEATALRVEARHRFLKYRQPAYNAYTGSLSEVSATLWQVLPDRWVVFAGPDWGDKDADNPADAYRQSGARIGLNKSFDNGFSAFLLVSQRRRDHQAYSALLEAKRRDDERNITAVLQAPRWAVKGFTPSLTLQHTRIRSNIDWLYSFERQSVSLRLERSF